MQLPDRHELSGIVERYARLRCLPGAGLDARPLVLPNGTFFPDRFTGDHESAERLVERMAMHAGMEDIPLNAVLVADDSGCAQGGCSSGCAVPAATDGSGPRLVDDGVGWSLRIPSQELSHSTVLTTMVARALGHVFLVETLPAGVAPDAPAELTADYAAVALGFGVLLMEGAYIYSTGCGGPSVAQVTRASLDELAVLAALFIAVGEHPARAAARELGVTQKALFTDAQDWVRSNDALVDRLKHNPARVAAGDYSLSESKPRLFRWFAESPREPELDARPVSRKSALPNPKHDELRALVDEALLAERLETD